MSDLISRQAAIDALWKALYEYEDKTEKQFLESEDLDVGDRILHRIFVQNLGGIEKKGQFYENKKEYGYLILHSDYTIIK